MKRNTKIAILFVVLVAYVGPMLLLKGRLSNQTANVVAVQGSKTQSLIPKQNMTYVNIPLEQERWHISGENISSSNFDDKLVISGNYENNVSYFNKTLPLFAARQTGLQLNFTKNPYLHIVVSNQPDAETCFYIGWHWPSKDALSRFLLRHNESMTEIDSSNGILWINISYPVGGEKTYGKTSYITIDAAERVAKLGLENQCFVGLQIRQYLIGFLSSGNYFETTVNLIGLAEEDSYSIAMTEGRSQTLEDGSTVHIIRKEDIEGDLNEWPYLQRAYILYTMDAPQNTLYTVFLLLKHDGNLTAVRSGFVFTHRSLLDEVGTYVDWRKPIPLDSSFEPIQVIQKIIENGDCAVIFTPIENGKLENTQVNGIVLTFSKLPYSAFATTKFDDGLVSAVSFFVLTVAGIVPTILMATLFYQHKKKTLKDTKKTILSLVCVGLGLRLILAAISAHADDTQIFSEIGALYFGSGVLGAQWVSLPGFAYIETAAYFPYALLRSTGFQDVQFLALNVYCVELLFTKIPAILADIGSFYFIWKIADKISPKNKPLIAGLYLLNPLTIYASGILGQFDGIFTFTLIALTYYLIVDYSVLKASLFSAFSAVLNPIGIATFVPFLSTTVTRKNWKTAVKGLLLIAGILCVSLAPFYFEQNSPVLLTSYERLIGGVPGEGTYGRQLNFYTYGAMVSSSVGYGLTFRFMLEILGLELGWWYYPFTAGAIFLAFIVAFFYKTYKTSGKGSQDQVHVGTFMLGVVCLFQLTFPTVYEQFAVWTAGLLLVSYALHQDKEVLVLFVLTCISSGLIYVATWRDYLLLASGVEGIRDQQLVNITSALVGVVYSIVLVIAFTLTCRLWFKEELSRFRQRIKDTFLRRDRSRLLGHTAPSTVSQ